MLDLIKRRSLQPSSCGERGRFGCTRSYGSRCQFSWFQLLLVRALPCSDPLPNVSFPVSYIALRQCQSSASPHHKVRSSAVRHSLDFQLAFKRNDDDDDWVPNIVRVFSVTNARRLTYAFAVSIGKPSEICHSMAGVSYSGSRKLAPFICSYKYVFLLFYLF